MDIPDNINEMIEEVRREIRIRHGFYKKLVASGKLTEEDARKKINLMDDVYHLLIELKKQKYPF